MHDAVTLFGMLALGIAPGTIAMFGLGALGVSLITAYEAGA